MGNKEPDIKHTGAEHINKCIEALKNDDLIDTNLITDGYHTFGELYEHRIQLWISLTKVIYSMSIGNIWLNVRTWKSKFHSDGSTFEGWFVLGVTLPDGKQMSYHLPNEKWEQCDFAKTLAKAPDWDGHTSADVLERLKQL